ncbi:MAG: glutathione S-transferase family protein [Neisseriaceae bacterium]|nr:glutathione S-transferase family protein [Neisseriaceae bacterium]
MYQLYIANKDTSSWSLRPWLLLKQFDIPFTERQYLFPPKGQDNGFKAFSPTAKVPCLSDQDSLIWDSLAITEYIAEAHPQAWPQQRAARAWARSACAEMHAGFVALRQHCPMVCSQRYALIDMPVELAQDLSRLDALWQSGLTQFHGPYLAGAEFSAVDAYFAPVVLRIVAYGLPLSVAAMAYVDTLLALPHLQAWQADALKEAALNPSNIPELAHAKLMTP